IDHSRALPGQRRECNRSRARRFPLPRLALRSAYNGSWTHTGHFEGWAPPGAQPRITVMVFSQLLMQALHEEVVGQEYAITALTRAVTLALAGMRNPNRPLAVLAFVGPTGSGKTNVAQTLARVLLADESRIAYVDCQRLSQSADPVSQSREQPVSGRWNQQASLPSQTSFLPPWLFQETLPASRQAGRLQQPFSIVVFDEADK